MSASVAELYPAYTDANGTTWYRAGTARQDGWTSDLAQAHEDYHQKGGQVPPQHANGTIPVSVDPQPQESEMTALTEDFTEAPRTTEYQGYPLPPPTPRPASVFGQWGWYRLPHPETGRPTLFPRATTVAKTLEDRENLAKWGRRETALRVAELARMDPDTRLNPLFETTARSALDALLAATDAKVTAVDAVLDMIDNMMGGAHARELGECVHAWLEALDMGIVLLRDVPELVRPHVDAYYRVMSHRGLVALPEYVERTVLNTQCEAEHGLSVAGKIDRVFRIVTTGDLCLGDVKTSKELTYSWLSFGVQVGGVYGWAERVLTPDGTGWEPMPELREDFAILMHVPSINPAGTAAITIDKWWGGEMLMSSAEIKNRRKEAKAEVPKHAIPAPSDHAIRYATARNALSEINTLDGTGWEAMPELREDFAILMHVPSNNPAGAAAITIDKWWGGEMLMSSAEIKNRRKQAPKAVPKHAVPPPSDKAIRYATARHALSAINTMDDGNAVYADFEDVWDDALDEHATRVAALLDQ